MVGSQIVLNPVGAALFLSGSEVGLELFGRSGLRCEARWPRQVHSGDRILSSDSKEKFFILREIFQSRP